MFIKTLLQYLLNTRTTKRQALDAGSVSSTPNVVQLSNTGIAPADGFLVTDTDFKSGGGSDIFLKVMVDGQEKNQLVGGGSFGSSGNHRDFVPISAGQGFYATSHNVNAFKVYFVPRALT